MKGKLCLLPALSLLIAGCGNPNIEAVKDSAFLVDETFTVAQALESRPICSDSSWEEFEDDRGRVIVEYRCELEGAGAYFEQSKGEVEEYVSHIIARGTEQEQKIIDGLKSELESAPQIIDRVIEEFKTKDQLNDFLFVRYRISPDSNCGVDTSSYSDGYSDDKAEKLRECLEKRIAKYELEIEERNTKIQDLQERIGKKFRAARVQSATEVFKWTLTEDAIYYDGGGVSLEFDEKPHLYFPYMKDGGRLGYNMKQALKDTLSDEFKDYSELADARSAVPTVRQVMAEL